MTVTALFAQLCILKDAPLALAMQAATAVPVGLAGPIWSAVPSGGLRSGNLRVYRGDYVLAGDKIHNI